MRLGRGKVILLLAVLAVLAVAPISHYFRIPTYLSNIATYLNHLDAPYFKVTKTFFPGPAFLNLGAPAKNVRIEWVTTRENGTIEHVSYPRGDVGWNVGSFQDFSLVLNPIPDGGRVVIKWDGGEQTLDV